MNEPGAETVDATSNGLYKIGGTAALICALMYLIALAVSEGTGGQYTGMPLVWLAGLILSSVMLRSKTFSKATAWVGILGLGLLVTSVPFAGYATAGPTMAIVSAIVVVT